MPGLTAFEDNKVDASSFLCLGNNPLVLSLRDPYTYNISSVTKQGIALLHRSGKQVIDAKLLQRMLDIFQPDIAILPAAEVPWYASNKQWSKSLSVTETLASIPLRSVERTSLVFLPICGGQSLDRWQRSIDSCVKRIAASASEGPLQQMGISIAGLQTGESPGERETLLAEIVSKCPEVHPRAVMGLSGGPLDVLMLVKSGIDVIEGTYPLELATLGEALSFATEMREGMGGEEEMTGKDGWKINLHDGIHRHANVPLVEGCDCYACRTHTRAYIHHLLVASEMLGETLLALYV
jgi:queuine tRNA-ribosyltransferase accessory subunit